MSSHHETLDPLVAAELAELDAALAGDAGTAPEWAALVAAIRDDAPEPSSRFHRELDERVAAGFPRARPTWLRLPRLAVAVPALASLLLLVGVAGVALQSGGGRDEVLTEAPPGGTGSGGESSEGAMGVPEAAPPQAATPLRADGAPAMPEGPSGSEVARSAATTTLTAPLVPERRNRRVERTTSLDLTTDAGGLQDAADGIVRGTQDLGGVVERSRVERSQTGGQATFALRIPTARLDDALKRFGELADVARLSEGSEDITGAFVSAQDRLSDARAERKALLSALGKAVTPRSIASLRARIRGNRAEIARLEGDLRGLRRRTDLARVDVTLSASGAAADPDAGGAWGPRDAADDALRVLEVLAGGALVAGAVLLPLAILGAGAALVAGGLRHRRREAALGGG